MARADVNVGKLPEEAVTPITRWTHAARWVDEQELAFAGRERGVIHQAA
jgi:hypothetical protein